jgi:hypothetical protein
MNDDYSTSGPRWLAYTSHSARWSYSSSPAPNSSRTILRPVTLGKLRKGKSCVLKRNCFSRRLAYSSSDLPHNTTMHCTVK